MLSVQTYDFERGQINSTEEHCVLTNQKLLSITQAYDAWQQEPTVTTLRTTAKPISDIAFPAITICGQGSISEVGAKQQCSFTL